jgi:hypothetical protein
MNSTPFSELESGLTMDLQPLSEHVRAVLGAGPLTSESVEALRAACVEALCGSDSIRRDEVALAAACAIVESFIRAGAVDSPVSAAVLATAESRCSAGWGGLLAAMLQVPAWQLSAAPRLADAPLALWSVYSEWLFRLPPRAVLPGQLDAMAGHYIQRLRELVAAAEANRGSAAVNAALERYAQAESAVLLVASTLSLRELVALRGKALGLWHKIPKAE